MEDLRLQSSWFYNIDDNKNLGAGSYLTYINAPDKVTLHFKSTKFDY